MAIAITQNLVENQQQTQYFITLFSQKNNMVVIEGSMFLLRFFSRIFRKINSTFLSHL